MCVIYLLAFKLCDGLVAGVEVVLTDSTTIETAGTARAVYVRPPSARLDKSTVMSVQLSTLNYHIIISPVGTRLGLLISKI